MCATAGAAGGPTGDPATIAFYRQVQAAYKPVHVLTFHRRGFTAYAVAGGTVFRYTVGEAAAAGLRPASESVLELLRNGRVVKFVDVARASRDPTLTYIEDASGAWAEVATRRCFYRETRLPGVWGQPFVGVFGDFAPMQRSGGSVIVRSTYSWGGAAGSMSEVDHISAATKQFSSISGRLSGPGGFSWSINALRPLATAPTAPSPTPHC